MFFLIDVENFKLGNLWISRRKSGQPLLKKSVDFKMSFLVSSFRPTKFFFRISALASKKEVKSKRVPDQIIFR